MAEELESMEMESNLVGVEAVTVSYKSYTWTVLVMSGWHTWQVGSGHMAMMLRNMVDA